MIKMSIKDEIEKMRNGEPLKDIPDWADTQAEALINTTLVINRDWESWAKPRYERFKSQYPEIKTVEDLNNLIKSISDEKDFCKKVLSLNIPKPGFVRYKMLCDMVTVFDKIDIQDWADDFDPFNPKSENDSVFQIYNVGLATIQNLRICLKIPTLKPDRRVINALEKLGYHTKNGFKIMNICQSILDETGYPLYHLDQIFWEKKYENQEMGGCNGRTKE